MTDTPVLLDLGGSALAHQAEVDEVRRHMHIDHHYFDCWIYGFLENKNFSVEEAVAKLKRRDEMEKTELKNIEITDWMIENMQQGIIQVIGNDKEGRIVFYVSTVRDKPTKARRAEARKNFDMFVSYGTRLRAENKRCQLVMLINQDKASLFSNVDMTFQADIALRIAKFYPGCIDKLYVCNMNSTLAAFAKPVFSRLPAIVSERIKIISSGDIKSGVLLEYFDKEVLPIDLGGTNACDTPENHKQFALTIVDYFRELQVSLRKGIGVKEWELMNLRNAGVLDVANSNAMTSLRETAFVSCTPSLLGDRDSVNNSMSELYTCGSVDEMKSMASNAMLVRYVPHSTIDFLDSTEKFFRTNIIETRDREWLEMFRGELEERQAVIKRGNQVHNESLLAPLPPYVRLLCRGFLSMCVTVIAIFFGFGSFFIAMFGVTNCLFLFFSTLSEPYNIFPYGLTLTIVLAQFTIFVSRGFELTANVFNGELILPLKAFGNRAHIFQVSICLLCLLACFLTFCSTANSLGWMEAFYLSITIGILVTVGLTFIYHVVFAFGFKKISRKHFSERSRYNTAETTIYLLLDVDLDNERHRSPVAEVIGSVVLALISFGFGLSFMLCEEVVFLCMGVIAQVIFLFGLVVSTTLNVLEASSTVVISSTSFASVVWIYTVFVFSKYGWKDGWGWSVLIAVTVCVVFIFTSFASSLGWLKKRRALWSLRVAWIEMFILYIASIIALFFTNYKCALFSSFLAVHLIVCLFRSSYSINNYGLATVAVIYLLFFVTCCLKGQTNVDEVYNYSVSSSLLPNFHNESLDRESGFPPLCRVMFPSVGSEAVNIVGAALFAKLGYNLNASAQAQDLQTWLPQYTVTKRFRSTNGHLHATVFESFEEKTMFVSLGTSRTLFDSIEDVTMWIEAVPTSFLSVIFPRKILFQLEGFFSFAKYITPLVWQKSSAEFDSFIEALCSDSDNTPKDIYLVGYSTTAMISSSGLTNKCEPKVITFLNPSTVSLSAEKNLTENVILHRAINVLAKGMFYTSWETNPVSQYLPCSRHGNCDSLDEVVKELNNLCKNRSS